VFWEAVDVFCAMYPKPEQRYDSFFSSFSLFPLLLSCSSLSLGSSTRRLFLPLSKVLTSCLYSAALVEYLGTTCWGLSADRVREMLTMHRPTVQSTPTTFTAGRVTLPVPAEVVCIFSFLFLFHIRTRFRFSLLVYFRLYYCAVFFLSTFSVEPKAVAGEAQCLCPDHRLSSSDGTHRRLCRHA